jgi:hypothetical protein
MTMILLIPVSKIDSITIRRIAILILFPLLAFTNVILSTISSILYFCFAIVSSNKLLFNTSKHYWSNNSEYNHPK